MNKDQNVIMNREKYVGGSDIPVIMGLSPYSTPYELALEKAELIEREPGASAYTEYGEILEPLIRSYINEQNNLNFKPSTKIHEENRIRCNVDGYEKDKGFLLEVKTHGANARQDMYEAQIQFYLHVFGLKTCWLAMYKRPADFEYNLDAYRFDANNLYIQLIEYDAAYAAKIMAAVDCFWRQVDELKKNPTMSEHEFYQIGNAEIMAVVSKLTEFENEIQRLKALEKESNNLRKELLDLMEKTGLKQINTGGVVVTYIAPTERKTVNTKLLAEELPDVYEKYMSLTPVKASVKVKTVVRN